jgi:superfamily I DNA/RNA helicase
LREILGELLETGAASKKVAALYGLLIEKTGNELGLLMDMPIAEIEGLKPPGLSGELLAAAIDRMRSGRVSISPGYDGEYGVIRAFAAGERPMLKSETELFENEVSGKPVVKAAGKKPVKASGIDKLPVSADLMVSVHPSVSAGQPRNSQKTVFILNGEQERAVFYTGKQAIIIAGPGTGKTAMLAARIARLVQEGTDPRSVLAVSFTVKAAAELGDRIAAALAEYTAAGISGDGHEQNAGMTHRITTGNIHNAAGVTAATFHSFCLSLLKDQAGKSGALKDFRIIGEGERDDILKEICGTEQNAETGKKRPGYQKLGKYIEGRKRLLIPPGEPAPKFGGPGFETLTSLAEELGIPETEPALEQLYGIYRDRLRSRGLIDFDDLVAGAVRLLSGNREQLFLCRKRFRFIFVDEYQDVNFAQYALIRLLTAAEDLFPAGNTFHDEPPSLWVIGDPNQAIYGFRGSDNRFISRFQTDYPDAGEFRLTQSFRCAAPIINAAGRLMDARLRGIEREVTLFRHEYPTEKAEAEGIARRISRLIGGTSFFAIDSDTADNGAAEGAVTDNAVLIRSAALAPPILKALRDHGIPFEYTGEKPWWEEEPVRALIGLLRETLYLSGGAGTEGPVFTPRSGVPAETVKEAWEFLLKSGRAGKKQEAAEFPERLISLAALYDDLAALLETLAIRGAGDAPDIQREGVKVMTIHASKGLEFDHVFIAALEEGLLPFTLYGEQHIDEERRLLYVAMTRARRGLCLSWARTRNFQGRKLESGPSRFLADLERMVPLAKDYQPRPKDPQMSLF